LIRAYDRAWLTVFLRRLTRAVRGNIPSYYLPHNRFPLFTPTRTAFVVLSIDEEIKRTHYCR